MVALGGMTADEEGWRDTWMSDTKEVKHWIGRCYREEVEAAICDGGRQWVVAATRGGGGGRSVV